MGILPMDAVFRVFLPQHAIVKPSLFNAISWVSLVLCAMMAALWLGSYVRVIGLDNHSRPHADSGIWDINGRLLLDTARHSEVPRWPGVDGLVTLHKAQIDWPAICRHAIRRSVQLPWCEGEPNDFTWRKGGDRRNRRPVLDDRCVVRGLANTSISLILDDASSAH